MDRLMTLGSTPAGRVVRALGGGVLILAASRTRGPARYALGLVGLLAAGAALLGLCP